MISKARFAFTSMTRIKNLRWRSKYHSSSWNDHQDTDSAFCVLNCIWRAALLQVLTVLNSVATMTGCKINRCTQSKKLSWTSLGRSTRCAPMTDFCLLVEGPTNRLPTKLSGMNNAAISGASFLTCLLVVPATQATASTICSSSYVAGTRHSKSSEQLKGLSQACDAQSGSIFNCSKVSCNHRPM